MRKSFIFASLLSAAVLVSMSHMAKAASGTDSVFIDEGEGDFDTTPIPAQTSKALPKKSTGKTKKADRNVASDVDSQVESVPVTAEPVDAAPAVADAPGAVETTHAAVHEEQTADTGDVAAPVVEETKAPQAPVHHGHVAKHHEEKWAGGTYVVTKEACPMMRQPASEGQPMLTVKASKKIWVEKVDANWVKGFNKAGEPGYISRDCVE